MDTPMQMSRPLMGTGLPGTVGWSVLIHGVLLVALVVAESLAPKSVVFRDVIQVDLVAPESPSKTPEAAPQAPPKLPPKGDPLWDKLAALPPPPAAPVPSLDEAFKALAPVSQKTPKAPPPVLDEDYAALWNKLQKLVPPEADEVRRSKEAPDPAATAEALKKLKAALAAKGEESPANPRDEEIARFFEQLDAAPASRRHSLARAKGGTPKYLAAVERRINARWSPPDIYRDWDQVMAVVVFPIMRDGSVGPVRMVTPSGSTQFDQAAVRSVMLASPFSPFPEEMKEPRMDVRFTFRLAKAGAG